MCSGRAIPVSHVVPVTIHDNKLLPVIVVVVVCGGMTLDHGALDLGMTVTTHLSYADYWLAQFSLTNVLKGGPKHKYVRFAITCFPAAIKLYEYNHDFVWVAF